MVSVPQQGKNCTIMVVTEHRTVHLERIQSSLDNKCSILAFDKILRFQLQHPCFQSSFEAQGSGSTFEFSTRGAGGGLHVCHFGFDKAEGRLKAGVLKLEA